MATATAIDRREFLAGSLVAGMFVASPVSSWAQTPGRVYRIAVFDFAPVSAQHPNAVAFFDELRRAGFEAGRNLVVERRDAGGDPERLAAVAAEVVDWKPDLITASSIGPNLAMRAATTTIPILMTGVGDPVRLGLVASLARPGSNITGITPVVPEGFGGKMLQLLHEAVPGVKRLAVLVNPANPMNRTFVEVEAPAPAQQLGFELRSYEVRAAGEVEDVLVIARRERCQAVWVLGDPVLNRPRLGALATAAGLPLISLTRSQTVAGGLMSYGPNIVDLFRRAGAMAARVLKGANPADLPVEQPAKFELVINLKTAAALGLVIPQSALLRADALIE